MGLKKNTKLVLKVTEDELLISPKKQIRERWEQKFKPSKGKLKNPSLLGDFPNEFDKDEWKR